MNKNMLIRHFNKQNKKFCCISLLCSSLLLTSCTQTQSPSQASSQSTPVSVGLTVYSLEDLYIQNMMIGFKNTESNAPNLTLTVVDGKNDQIHQNTEVTNLLNKGNQALLVNMVDVSAGSSAGQDLTNKSKEKDVPIVFFNRHPGSRVMQSYDKAYYVGSVAAQSGILQGEMIVADWEKNPNWDLNKDGVLQYVILKGQEGHDDAEGRTKWVAATIGSYPNKGIKAKQMQVIVANWRTDEAKQKLGEWLTTSENQAVEVIVTNNDAMAFGAIEALKNAGLERPVYGVDAMPEALTLIKQGKMTGTVLQDAQKQAEQALKLAMNLGAKTEVSQGLDFKVIEREMMVPYVAITKENIDTYIK